jgi:hypothetical protein
MSFYSLASTDAASLLRYAFGPDSHTRTVRGDDRRVLFEFNAPEDECREIVRTFFDPQGAAVDNVKELLDANRSIRRSISVALREGEWRNENAN